MAILQLVSDDLGDLQRQAAEFTPTKTKRPSARTFSACVCCACTA
jgi:hypothetical protein